MMAGGYRRSPRGSGGGGRRIVRSGPAGSAGRLRAAIRTAGARGPAAAGGARRDEDTGQQGRTRGMATEAYCVKCREKREMKDAQQVTMKNGRTAMQGVCPVCGTKLNRILGKDKGDK